MERLRWIPAVADSPWARDRARR